jgi:hypothetical protein
MAGLYEVRYQYGVGGDLGMIWWIRESKDRHVQPLLTLIDPSECPGTALVSHIIMIMEEASWKRENSRRLEVVGKGRVDILDVSLSQHHQHKAVGVFAPLIPLYITTRTENQGVG